MDIFKDTHHNGYQIRSKNTAFFVRFDSLKKEEIFLSLVKILQDKAPHSLSDLKKQLTNQKFEEILVTDVLNTCVQQYLFSASSGNPSDTEENILQIFDTSNTATEMTYNNIHAQHICLLSSHTLFTEVFAKKIKRYPYKKVSYKKYEDIPKENTELFLEQWIEKEKINFIIADTHAWNPYILTAFNKVALKKKIPWLYVGGIESGKLKFGPLFYGKETGCLNCLISRIKSNHQYPSFLSTYEDYLMSTKKTSAQDSFFYVNEYYPLLTDYIVLELLSFFEMKYPLQTWKTMISLDIFNYNLQKHILLKLPYCISCKPELQSTLSPWLEGIAVANP